MDELIYSQADMDDVLEQLSNAQEDAELLKQLLYVLVENMGGTVHIPWLAWPSENQGDKEIYFWDDPATERLYISLHEPVESDYQWN